MAVDEESVAVAATGATGVPETLDWSPGPAMVIELVASQVKVVDPVNPVSSVAVTVTG